MTAEAYTFKVDRSGGTAVVTLAGELDMAATFRIEPALERLAGEAGVKTLVIQMKGVEFMDSTMLGLLLATQQRLQTAGIRLLLADPSESVRRMLELTGVSDALSVTTWPPAE